LLGKGGQWNGEIKLVPELLGQPVRWARARRIFINSMSDLFHEGVPFPYVAAVLAVVAATPRHTYQVLTKRPARMLDFFRWLDQECPPGAAERYAASAEGQEAQHLREASGRPSLEGIESVCRLLEAASPVLDEVFAAHRTDVGLKRLKVPRDTAWPLPNLWLGVSIEDQSAADSRVPLLLDTPAALRWLSMEPLLGPVTFAATDRGATGSDGLEHLRSLDWVVVGGESGEKARPMHPAWVEEIRDQCQAANVPFLFKQWGEWCPRSDCYHTLTNGESAASLDPKATRWPCVRLTQLGGNGHNLADVTANGNDVYMQKVGRQLAGRAFMGSLLDGYPSTGPEAS
jgi:protein gp37